MNFDPYRDAAQPANSSPISTELDSLHKSVGTLHERIKILTDRISSVLAPDPPSALLAANNAKPAPPLSPLALRIADTAAGLRDAESALASLIARIQL